MASEHRKIELQTPGDLSYLITQIRTAARAKLDLHLPPVSSETAEPDELRRKTEELVDRFVEGMLQGMQRNVTINGIDVAPGDTEEDGAKGGELGLEGGGAEGRGDGGIVEEFEPWDAKLRDKLQDTVQKRDLLVAKIAAHRRNTAKSASQRFQDQFLKDTESLERQRVEAEAKATSMDGVEVADVGALKRQEEVERNWERAVQGLERLNKGLPETRARLERCGDVVGYLKGKKGVA